MRQHSDPTTMHHDAYRRLLIMAALSFLSMYSLMYAMVDTWSSVYANVNQAYMAGLMTAPMIVIELILMAAMYRSRRLNVLLGSVAIAAGALCFLFIRQQTAVGDGQFLRSMIPHHSGAILMCERAPIQDPQIRDLCAGIITSQRAEIAQMGTMLGTSATSR
jgi:uncharacterized protein (DUF305 family)